MNELLFYLKTTKGYLIYYKIQFENDFIISDLSHAQTSWYLFNIVLELEFFFESIY